MPNHAIVIGINTYPGLSNLKGPVNDAQAFHAWVTDPRGGNVAAANARLVVSNGFVAGEPTNTAKPNRLDLEELFRDFVVKGATAERIGDRLFIYLAGHGFADSNDANSSALLSADAQRAWPSHLAILKYVDYLKRAAVFDELVVLIDACRDTKLTWSICDPQLQAIAPHPKTKDVKVFKAFATCYGDVAREKDTGNGVYRGAFTLALLDALKHTEPDDQRRVLGSKVRDYLFNVFPNFAVNAADEPEIVVEDRRDVTFATTPILFAAGAVPANYLKVLTVRASAPSVGRRFVIKHSDAVVTSFTLAAEPIYLHLSPGIYAGEYEDGATPRIIFDIPAHEYIDV